MPNKKAEQRKASESRLTDLLKEPMDPLFPKEEVFLHYCSLDAFYSIMDSGRLRFTSAKSTNDPSEFVFGQDIVDALLQDPPPKLSASQRGWVKDAAKLRDVLDFRAFVFCMSEALGDEAEVGELSEWRLYGSDGRGVALVFDTSDQRRATLLEELGWTCPDLVERLSAGDGHFGLE